MLGGLTGSTYPQPNGGDVPHESAPTLTPGEGVVSGRLLQACRASAGLRQAELAERLGVGVTTVQGWESGRRPLTSVRVGQYMTVRSELSAAGAAAGLIGLLANGLDVDHLIRVSLAGSAWPEPAHPLSCSVMSSDTAALFAWAVRGRAPGQIADNGPRLSVDTERPLLSASVRRALFDHLRSTALTATGAGAKAVLMRRQASYLLGYDVDSQSAAVLRELQRRPATATRGPGAWAESRSVASGLARSGNREALTHFVASLSEDDAAEAANLAYWAYWVGEITQQQASDDFMATFAPSSFHGGRLLDYLTERLTPGLSYVEMTAHSIWSLLAVKKSLLEERPDTAQALLRKVGLLLDGAEVSGRCRIELEGVRYALKLAGIR